MQVGISGSGGGCVGWFFWCVCHRRGCWFEGGEGVRDPRCAAGVLDSLVDSVVCGGVAAKVFDGVFPFRRWSCVRFLPWVYWPELDMAVWLVTVGRHFFLMERVGWTSGIDCMMRRWLLTG